MSISDEIILMKTGVIQQIGAPQTVYDDPENLFVAKFLGTPPINVFDGEVKDGGVYLGDDRILEAPELKCGRIIVGIRPEGFVPDENGCLRCTLERIEVMGRDRSVLCRNGACANRIRAIVPATKDVKMAGDTVRFSLMPDKVLLFDAQTEERIRV